MSSRAPSIAHNVKSSSKEGPRRLVIRNIGLLLSGDLAQPILDADMVVAVDGRIVYVGREKDVPPDEDGNSIGRAGADTLNIDAAGAALCPGLIDNHVHPVAGDWTPRQNQTGWIESSLHGGVTTMISAGEVHMPGRPKDIVGLKAMAIFHQRAYANLRPSSVKVLAGAPIVEQGMVESDFAELAAAGVRLLGEIGLGSVKTGGEAAQMVAWARKYGMQSTIHTGGPSIPGSGLMNAQTVLEADADMIGHINGGHTALPDDDVRRLVEHSSRGLELVHNGNLRSALVTLRLARECGQLGRVVLGTDGPAGSGVQPLGILRMVAMLSSLGEVAAEQVFCFATGNTARMRGLDCGIVQVGRSADFVLLDKARHSCGEDMLQSVQLGNIPGVGMTIIDGVVCCECSRNTPPADRQPIVQTR